MPVLFVGGPPDVRVAVYNPRATELLAIDASQDFGGGQIQYEDTPSGCGAATLQLGLTNEQLVSKGYWQTYNIVEISTGDDVLQTATAGVGAGGSLKLYVTSKKPYDTSIGEDAPQVYLWDGSTLTSQMNVTSVGHDGGGDFIMVNTPLYGGGIPGYTAGVILGRRRYAGRIIRRSRPNKKQPLATLSLVGLVNTFDGAVGSFAFTNTDVGDAVYLIIAQFAGGDYSWASFLGIDPSEFPTVGTKYTGSGDQTSVSRMISDALSSIANGDLWVLRVGHDRTPRLLKLYDGSSDTYVYSKTLQQGVTAFEVVDAEVDDDASQFANSVEVIGGDDARTKQPFAAIVRDTLSISTWFQVDAPPVTNTKLPSIAACASYATSILNQSSQPRTNNQMRIYTRNDSLVPASLSPTGLSLGDVVRGIDKVTIQGFDEIGTVINSVPDSELQWPGPSISMITQQVSSPGSHTVNVDSTEFLTVGEVITVGTGADQENVTITAIGVGTITAVFANTHNAYAPIWSSSVVELWSAAFSSGKPLGFSLLGGSGGSSAFTGYNGMASTAGMKSRPFAVSQGQRWGISCYIDATHMSAGLLRVALCSGADPTVVYGSVDQSAALSGTVSTTGIVIPANETTCILVVYPVGVTIAANQPVFWSHPHAQRAGASVDPYVANYATLDEFGLTGSAQTTIQPGRDTWQDVKFAAIEPDWRSSIGERANAMATAMRFNLINGPGLDQYFISIGAWNPRLAHLTGAVTGSGSPQTVPVDDTSGLQLDGTYAIDQDGNLELVKITAIPDSTHITGIFTQSHTSGKPVWSGVAGEPTPQWTSGSLVVTVNQFEAVFGLGTGPVVVGGNTFSCLASCTNWVWLNPDGTWTVNNGPQTVPGSILFAIFTANATGVVGGALKAPIGYLGLPASYNLPSGPYVPTKSGVSITETVRGQFVSQVQVQFEITNQPTDGSLAHINCWYRQTGQSIWLLLASSPVCDNTGAPAKAGTLPRVGLYTFLFPDAANGTSLDFGFTAVDTENGETALTSGTSGTGWLGQITTSPVTSSPNLVTDSEWAQTSFDSNGKAARSRWWDFFLIDGRNVYVLQGGSPDGFNSFALDKLKADTGQDVYGKSTPLVAVKEGQQYIASAWIDATKATNDKMQVEILDQTGRAGRGNFGPLLVSVNQIHGQAGFVTTAVLTIPHGVTAIALNLHFNEVAMSGAPTDIVWFAEPQLVESSYPLAYEATGGKGKQQADETSEYTPLGSYVQSGCLSTATPGSLTMTNPGGVIYVGGFPIYVPQQDITYSASATWYDFVDDTGIITPQSSPILPRHTATLLQIVVAGSSGIVSVTDSRRVPSVGNGFAYDAASQSFLPSTSGGVAVAGHGSSFPGSPVDGELYYRDDLGELFIYETGLGWLTCTPSVVAGMTAAIAAGHSSDTSVYSGASTLVNVLVTTSGTNGMAFTDGPSGTEIGAISANAPVGSLFSFNMPASVGIYAVGNAANPGVTVNFKTGLPTPASAATTAIASGHVSDTAISGVSSLLRIVVTADNTHAMVITDGSGGTEIGYVPVKAPIGWSQDFEMPVASSIYVVGDANNPGVTISHA